MRPGTLLRLALAGSRTDVVRVVLTTLSAVLATLAGLAALTVLAIPTPPGGDPYAQSEQYASALLREPGLRGGTAFALLLLTIPVLALAGQCARLGAPARDRRLAALRLAGATPGQVTRIAIAETGLAGLLGTLLGLAAYLGGRALLHRPDARGQLPLPTDVLPSTGAILAVVLGLPLLAALAGALLLRRVSATPFGVVRRAARERPPGPWAGVLILGGLAAIAAIGPVQDWYRDHHREQPVLLLPSLLLLGGLAATLGVVVGTGWLSYTAGRLLHRSARRPDTLLAAGRLTADPWAGSRTFAALLAAVIVGGGAAGVRAGISADLEVGRRTGAGIAGDDDFYLGTLDLVDLAVGVALLIAGGGLVVALVEQIAARRRANAALVATGVPRATIGRSIAWQAFAPAVPAVAVALTVGLLLGRAVTGGGSRQGGYAQEICDAGTLCDDPATRAAYTRTEWVPEVSVAPDVPLAQLAGVGAGALVAVLITVGVGLLFLRASTAVEELRAG
ncbi:FtsX-like permease family protein [Micromonospora citrea]|uniref:FtsX-like permease family protein n=1 Tax=Micromonospora citrea TaxID=47855 RepID=UPI003C67B9EC